ncbi:hypothetical protein IFM89_035109 [Coptis chinensis]|uniref:Uncharacterized protein n=1 Tax=Coptis chinensis TaxID=261450 RepID=A0A835M5K2_9MAGN|nr:hypothetical protein IFM89_035109 [Coptis chinensis]
MTSNKELWLIQWPVNQTTDFDGQDMTLKLQRNGNFASFETLLGKSYELVSFASQVPDATVFQSSATNTKVVTMFQIQGGSHSCKECCEGLYGCGVQSANWIGLPIVLLKITIRNQRGVVGGVVSGGVVGVDIAEQ